MECDATGRNYVDGMGREEVRLIGWDGIAGMGWDPWDGVGLMGSEGSIGWYRLLWDGINSWSLFCDHALDCYMVMS